MQRWQWAVATTVMILAAAATAAWFFFLSPLPADTDVLPEEGCDGTVCITYDHGVTATPDGDDPTVGLVFLPGARVESTAYAPLAAEIARRGHLVVVPELTLNLAVLDQGAADAVRSDHPDIDRWAVGGHSLGGAMASRDAAEHDEVGGLALVAAWPEASLDLSDTDLAVVSVYGTADGVAEPAEVLAARDRLPDSAEFVAIEGGNHAQFGAYGPQRGDNPAAIPADRQRAETAAAIADLLDRLEQADAATRDDHATRLWITSDAVSTKSSVRSRWTSAASRVTVYGDTGTATRRDSVDGTRGG